MSATQITPEARAAILDRIDGRPVVVSVSGGKDSTATALYLRELGVEATYLHMDTGWEHPDTEAYVREYLPTVLGHIEIRGRPGGMAALVLSRAMFPGRGVRFCTQELKVWIARDYFATIADPVVNPVGIRSAESKKRAAMLEWERSDWFDGDTWRPLIRWTLDDVIAIHARYGVKPNPLYLRGAVRVGCYPCIHANKAEIRLMADNDPWAIDRLRALEAEVGALARARAEARGDDMTTWTPPAWFQARIAHGPRGTPGAFPCWPIDKVVEWSRTSRGGRQFELFDSTPADAGCMRWGLCETAGEP